MKKSMSWVFVGVFIVFAALSGCFPNITGRVDVRADSRDLAGVLASPAATASTPISGEGTVSSGLSEDDLAKIGKVVKDNVPATASEVAPKTRIKSLNRLSDGAFEGTGYGDGLFGGLSASGSVRAFARNQAVDRDGKLVLWMTAESSAGAYEFRQDHDDVTESSFALRVGVTEETFAADVTGTASPAVVIDLAAKLFRLDPAQNIFGFESFPLIGGWYPEQNDTVATERMVAWGRRMALLYIEGPVANDRGWYRWSDPAEPKKPSWDWGGMATRFTEETPMSLLYIPATGSPPVAWFSILTSTGEHTLVDERSALSAR